MNNSIYLVSEAGATLAVIGDDEIASISRESAVSPVGEEMYIDTFTPILNYRAGSGDNIYEILRPSDVSGGDYVYSGFKTNESPSKILRVNARVGLQSLPFGTGVKYYQNGSIAGSYYLSNVERLGETKYRLNCTSAIGLLDKQIHPGGIYTGQKFANVVDEIIGDSISDYTISVDVVNIEIYGWLPYATKRQNLYQVTMATGVSILRNTNGTMHFTFLDSGATTRSIPPSETFEGGTVTYDTHASKIEVVEHGYYYYSSNPREVVFDNTNSETLLDGTVLFGKPVYPESLQCTGSLTISEAHVNYCIATGSGTITGIPYIHTTRVVSRTNPGVYTDKVIRVEDATLVTAVNADTVARRLAAYYFNVTHSRSDIVMSNSVRCGISYIVENAYHERQQSFVTKLSSRVSSFERATCEFVNGYIPIDSGNTFTHVTDPPLEATGYERVWEVPQSVKEKPSPLIRVVLIGKGATGQRGKDGDPGVTSESPLESPGGAGGKGGEGGDGGKIVIQTLDCTGIDSFSYRSDAVGNIHFSGGEYDLSSELGSPSPTGFYEQITKQIYAEPGYPGLDGGAGGIGGRYNPVAALVQASVGENVEYEGVEYNGGDKATLEYYPAGTGVNDSGIPNTRLYIGSGGGGGAAVGGDGYDGQGKITPRPDGYVGVGKGGNGGDAMQGDLPKHVYGTGGNGGHGGGGGGGGGEILFYNVPSSSVRTRTPGRGGNGGTGGIGTEGYKGCIIIYY